MTVELQEVDPLTPLSARTLRRAEVTLLAVLNFPLEQADNAVDIAQLESGWNTGARNTDGEDSRGLWQLNVANGAHSQLRNWNLFDPQINAYFAAQIWRASGWRAWYNSAVKLGLIEG